MELTLKVVTCLVCVSIVRAEILKTDSDSFVQYMTTYDKQYATKEEYEKRFRIWQQHVEFIQQHNNEAAKGLHSYTTGVNTFTDLTPEEYRDRMLTFQGQLKKVNVQQTSVDTLSASDLPESIDWKAKGYVTEVGNQGQCGSCWAFTATGALEGAHKKKTGKLVDLSEQNLMNCSGKLGTMGCYGGFMDTAFKYVKQNGGIDTEESYPYNETNPGAYTCRYRKKNRGATCTGYVDLPAGNETALQEALANIGPISAAVDASHEGFQSYKSGVYDDTFCNPRQVDHSLLVVGYGIENGVEYYNCKNSWGTAWGDNGYIKMVRNKNNQCGIASTASYPTV